MPVSDNSVKFSFLTEFHLIMDDFEKILQFVEPSDENLATFSHRIYELQLRTCTAFEAVSKNILIDQHYTLPPDVRRHEMNIEDYFTLNSQYRLNEYKVLFGAWRSGAKELIPFSAWNGSTYAPLPWYQAYNHSKHDRHQNFKEANLEKLLDAISGLFVILYALYKENVFGRYQDNDFYNEDNDYIWARDSIFSIKPPSTT